jgi:hypothetical protein
MAGITRMGELWASASKVRAEADEKIAAAMEKTAGHLDRLADNESATRDALTKLRSDAQVAQGANVELLGAIRSAIEQVPNLTADELEQRIGPLFTKAQDQLTSAATSLLSANTNIEQVARLLRAKAERRDGIDAAPDTAKEGDDVN